VNLQDALGGAARSQMIAVRVGRLNETLGEALRHPAVEDNITLVRQVHLRIAPPPFVKGPGIFRNGPKGARRCEVLGKEPLVAKHREVAPIAFAVPKGRNARLRAHSGARQEENAPGGSHPLGGGFEGRVHRPFISVLERLCNAPHGEGVRS